jgi:hypothetical protein
MASVSGLSKANRARARRKVLRAAMLGFQRREKINYTMGSLRWSGIDRHRNASEGEYPVYADCSAYATWCLWNGLFLPFGVRDTVNGAGWRAGYTGTMLKHGKRVEHQENVLVGDCMLYGRKGTTGAHVAIAVGKRNGKVMVVSHGSQGGPYYVPYDYRSDRMGWRRYI